MWSVRHRWWLAGIAGGLVVVGVAALWPHEPPTLKERFAAEREVLQALVRADDVPAALVRLRQVAEADVTLAGHCHGLAHAIGHAALDTFGWARAVQLTDDICGSGVLHGVVERRFSTVERAELPTLTRDLCPPDDRRCFHGLGHGLMVAVGDDVPAALALCATLTGFRRIQCAEGVYMEWFGLESDHGRIPNVDTFLPLCLGVADPERAVCAFYAPRAYLTAKPLAYIEARAWCQQLPAATVLACLKGVGSAAMKAHVLEPALALRACEELVDDALAACVQGLVSYRAVHFASGAKAADLCQLLTGVDASSCERGIAEAVRAYGS
jgi:hypothetical protein